MTLQEKLNAAIAKGWRCNPQTGEVWSHKDKLINKIHKDKYIYCQIYIDGKREKFSAHQFIYYWHTGIVPNVIDHQDSDKSNNKITNLSNGTQSENQHNRKSTKGYCWNKTNKKWEAQIHLDNKKIHLGLFDTEQEARQAYLDAKKIYHPTKCRLFIS